MAEDRATLNDLSDLEGKIGAGGSLTRAEAERVAASPDLPAIGQLGELARKARHGNRVTFVRVCEWSGAAGGEPGEQGEQGEAGEVRLTGAPESADAAIARVRDARRRAPGVLLSAYSLADLLQVCGGDHLALADLATALKREGLEAAAEVPIDRLGGEDEVVEAIAAAHRGGLATWRATIAHARFAERLALIERAAVVQRRGGGFKAFAPLSQADSVEQPSTGYDDVRSIALARLVCGDIPSIQVDWQLYGPKLAQVAIAFGADDIDRVASVDAGDLGRRRSAREDIVRQIQMALAEPVERDGRFDTRV